MPVPTTAPPRPPTSRADALRAIDWRTVAAVGLPLWAFVLGLVVARPGAAPEPALALAAQVATAQEFPPEPPAAAPAVPEAPPPREVVVRHEVIGVPIAVPIPAAPEPVAALPMPPGDDFRLPASELLPADRCQTFGTKIKFHAGVPEAAEEARVSKKMLLVLHISGHFDDPGFT